MTQILKLYFYSRSSAAQFGGLSGQLGADTTLRQVRIDGHIRPLNFSLDNQNQVSSAESTLASILRGAQWIIDWVTLNTQGDIVIQAQVQKQFSLSQIGSALKSALSQYLTFTSGPRAKETNVPVATTNPAATTPQASGSRYLELKIAGALNFTSSFGDIRQTVANTLNSGGLSVTGVNVPSPALYPGGSIGLQVFATVGASNSDDDVTRVARQFLSSIMTVESISIVRTAASYTDPNTGATGAHQPSAASDWFGNIDWSAPVAGLGGLTVGVLAGGALVLILLAKK